MVIGRGLLVSVLVPAVLVSPPVHAQVAGATLAGTVTDASGAVVPNANVSIKNTATGVARDISTDSAGFYRASLGFDPTTVANRFVEQHPQRKLRHKLEPE